MSRFVPSVSLPLGLAALLLGPALPSGAQDPEKPAPAETTKDKAKAKDDAKSADDKEKPKLEQAVLGGGCFWCLEAVYERIPGVKNVVSGYAGGTTRRPTYDAVSAGITGHAEVVQIDFDPAEITYAKLLEIFFEIHDPTTLNSQGPDFGTQYRSIILYEDDAQKQAALKLYDELTRARAFRAPIVTELVPLKAFYPAEKHHQDYFRRNPNAPYCQMQIVPKVRKMMMKGEIPEPISSSISKKKK